MNKKMTHEQEKAMFAKQKSGKTYKRDYSTDRPSFSTRSAVHGDVKKIMHKDEKIMHKDDSLDSGGKDFDAYQRRLKHHSEEVYLKEQRRAEKRKIHEVKSGAKKERKEKKKSGKKEKKDIKKEEKLMEKQTKSGFAEDNQEVENTRETIQKVEGN